MPKPTRLPEVVNAGGQIYELRVFLIHSKNPDGSPGLCKLIPDDRSIDLAGGEEFMTCYVPRIMFPAKK